MRGRLALLAFLLPVAAFAQRVDTTAVDPDRYEPEWLNASVCYKF